MTKADNGVERASVYSLLCPLAFVVAAVLLSIPMRKNPRFIQLSRLTPAFVFLLILNVACALAWAPQDFIPPGWSQRFNLVGYFFWLTFAGLSLLSSVKKAPGAPLHSEIGVTRSVGHRRLAAS